MYENASLSFPITLYFTRNTMDFIFLAIGLFMRFLLLAGVKEKLITFCLLYPNQSERLVSVFREQP